MNKIVFVAFVLFASLILGQILVLSPIKKTEDSKYLSIPVEQIRSNSPDKVFEDADVEIYRLGNRYVAIRKDVAV